MLNCAYLENRRTGAAATPANLTRYAIYYRRSHALLLQRSAARGLAVPMTA